MGKPEAKHAGYYEAILQLRDCEEEVIDFAEEEIEKERVYVAKRREEKRGQDIYLGNKKFAQQLGKKLKEKFGGECRVTATLWGKKKDKEIYRLTVLFRGVSFKKGEEVVYQGEEYKIVMVGKDILLQKKKTGEKVHLKYREKEKIKK